MALSSAHLVDPAYTTTTRDTNSLTQSTQTAIVNELGWTESAKVEGSVTEDSDWLLPH